MMISSMFGCADFEAHASCGHADICRDAIELPSGSACPPIETSVRALRRAPSPMPAILVVSPPAINLSRGSYIDTAAHAFGGFVGNHY